MFSIITTFLKGHALKFGIGLLITAVISGGGWFINNKISNLQTELKQQIEVSAIVTNEYDRSLKILETQKREFELFRKDMVFMDGLLKDKQREDNKVANGIINIRGGLNEVIVEKDGEISDVLIDTLNGIRVLRESTKSSREGESGGDNEVPQDGDTK